LTAGYSRPSASSPISLNRKPAYLCPRKKAAGSAPLPRAAANAS
jgi:hypothetical protein